MIKRALKYTVLAVVIPGVVVFGAIWALIEARAFNSWRAELLAEALTIQVGQRVEVKGDVRIALGLPTRIVVTDVRIPGPEPENFELAKLDVLSLETNVPELLQGTLDFDRLNVTGLFVHLLGREDRGNTRAIEDPGKGAEIIAENNGPASAGEWYGMASELVRFVRLRSDTFKSVRILFENEVTGFTFDFNLDELSFRREDFGQTLLVNSTGSVNGAPFDFRGDYGHTGPFSTDVAFADIVLSYDGTSELTEEGRTYEAKLELETGQIGELLEILKLQRSFEGTGVLRATVRHSGEVISVSDASAELDLAGGQRITASGSVGDLLRLGDMALETRVNFQPDGREPSHAHKLSDVRLIAVEAMVLGNDGEIYVEDAIVHTNGFEQKLDELGPVSVGRVQRTDDGRLSLLDVLIKAGPAGAPILSAQGRIRDLLRGRNFKFDGTFAVSAGLLFSRLDEETAGRFGGIHADFNLDDIYGYPRLGDLTARSTGTDLWSLRARAQSGLGETPKSLDLDIALEVPDGARFLGGLGLKEVAVAPLGLTMTGHADKNGLTSDIGLNAGQSWLSTSLALDAPQNRTRLVGQVSSEELFLGDLRLAMIGIGEMRGFLSDGKAEKTVAGKGAQQVEVQPLVLPKTERTLFSLLQEPDVQPLVLPRPDVTLESLLAEDGVRPLVLSDQETRLKDFLNLKTLFLNTDVDIAIEIKKLSGAKGVSSLSSELIASGGKASLGPVNVRYGGGFVSVEASMDLIKSPDRVRLSGSTGGWDIGPILEAIGQDVVANGIIEGRFDLTGSQKSIRDFANSMQGNVRLRMSRGSISTSLIELAGMGILPWFFSQERRQGHARIDCLAAPLGFAAGKVSLSDVVIETAKVQMVARGALDWRQDTIAIRAGPRVIGKPLSRSPWPFTLSGQLSKPVLKLVVGGSRVRRADQASSMPARRKACVPDILQLQ